MMKKRKLILGFILLLAIFVVGCKENVTSQESEEVQEKVEAKAEDNEKLDVPDTLTTAIGKDIGDLNGHLYGGDMTSQGLVFEGLVENSNEGPKPSLAERWEISPDGKVYTFYLRKNVSFTDGELFNAAAVKANIDAVQENKETHGWLHLSKKIVSCDVVDEYVVNLVLSDSYYPTLMELGLTRPYKMMSPATFIDGSTKNGVNAIVGTGAYKLENHIVDQQATFVANEDYWGGAPAIKEFKMKVMPAGETTLFAMLNNEIDFIFSSDTSGMIDVEALKTLQKDDDFQVVKSPPCSTRHLLTNSLADRVTSDPNIKEAIWHAINRESIAQHIFSDFETPAERIFSSEIPYCDVSLDKRAYDKEKAKSLIEASGWVYDDGTGYYMKGNESLKLELTYSSNVTGTKNLSEFIQGSLKEVGIEVVLMPAEFERIRKIRKVGDYDLILDRTWGLPYDPQSTLTSVFVSYLNAIKTLESYDKLKASVDNALISTDEEKRTALIHEAISIIHDDCVFIPLSYSSSIIVAKKDLKGISFNQTQFEFPLKALHY